MKTIAYYISDYGYGHATRSLAVIRKLLEMNKDVNVLVCHSYALSFLKEALKSERVIFRDVATDIGFFIKENSIEPDREKMKLEYEKYVESFPNLIDKESQYLQKEEVDLVVSDIFPIAFEAARVAGIPSVGISNFTWYTAYLDLIDEEALEPLKQAYQKMDHYFSLAACNEPKWGKEMTEFGFYARENDDKEVTRLRNQLLQNGEKWLIYVGFGMKIDVRELEGLPIWEHPDCHFIFASNLKLDRPNVTTIPKEYVESQHFVAASDLVITKPGWGTVSEAVLSNTPLLILERSAMKEDQNTIDYLRAINRCTTVGWDEFFDLKLKESFLQEIMQQKNRPVPEDCLEDIVKRLVRLVLGT